METRISASWLLKGFFDFSGQDAHHTTTQEIKAALCVALGLPEESLHIKLFPVGANRKHTFWWREGDVDYAEAQFFMQVSDAHPVLSLGVSLEKGLEGHAPRPEERMDRATWTWPRFVEQLRTILSTDVPAAATALGASVNVRISGQTNAKDGWKTRTFCYVDGQWFQRHVGRATPDAIVDQIRQLDGERDSWGIVHFACDLSPERADGMPAADAAAILLKFQAIRRRLSSAVEA